MNAVRKELIVWASTLAWLGAAVLCIFVIAFLWRVHVAAGAVAAIAAILVFTQLLLSRDSKYKSLHYLWIAIAWMTLVIFTFAFLGVAWSTSNSKAAALGIAGGITVSAILLGVLITTQKVKPEMHVPFSATFGTIIELSIMGFVFRATWFAVDHFYPLPATSNRTDGYMMIFALLCLAAVTRLWLFHSRQIKKTAEAEVAAANAAAAAAENERKVAEAELRVVRARIEPHFLWNTLGNLEFYIQKKSTDEALDFVRSITGYLRGALPSDRGEVSPLSSEIECVRHYLNLMEKRMGGRLSTEIVYDQVLDDMPFGTLLIQPLVENAVKHGVEPKIGPVSISVRVDVDTRPPALLAIDVRDNGVGGHAVSPVKGTGFGLEGIRKTLAHMYGPRALLSTTALPEGGYLSRITIPLEALDLSDTERKRLLRREGPISEHPTV